MEHPLWLDAAVKPLHVRHLPSGHESLKPLSTEPTTNKALFSSSTYNTQCATSSRQISPKSLKIRTTTIQKVIRPLPAIPASSPISPSTPRSPRPLPTIPCTSSSSNATSFTSLDVENATPSVASESNELATQRPFGQELLVSPEFRITSEPGIPLSASLPDDQSRNLSLLRLPESDSKHLRSNNFHNNVSLYDPSPTIVVWEGDEAARQETLDYLGRYTLSYLEATFPVRNCTSSSDDEAWEDENQDKVDYLPVHKVSQFPIAARFSRHWVREKRGRRREESDYEAVIHTLRSL